MLLYSILFPLFRHPVFATYVVILLVLIFSVYRLFLHLKSKKSGGSSFKKKLVYYGLWLLEIYLVFMVFWYIFVHFKSYTLM